MVRDPVDRAYSNWVHAWSDGLEPIDNFAEACAAEDARVDAGWAPFWHYRRLGRYGEQLAHLYGLFPASRSTCSATRIWSTRRASRSNEISAFLGVEQNLLAMVPPENTRTFVAPSPQSRAIATLIRAGAAAGAHAPPQVWRQASRPLVWALQRNRTTRPELAVEDRRHLVESFADDVRRLESLTGRSFEGWLDDEGRGEFSTRRLGIAP